MRNQPNHPEVSPLFTANPIADVSLSIQPSVLLFALSLTFCPLLSVNRSLVFTPFHFLSLSLHHFLSLSIYRSLSQFCPFPFLYPPSFWPQCLFAAALANPNRGWSVFALNLSLRETGPLESNKTRYHVRAVWSSRSVVLLPREKIVIFDVHARCPSRLVFAARWIFHYDRSTLDDGGWKDSRGRYFRVWISVLVRSWRTQRRIVRTETVCSREIHCTRERLYKQIGQWPRLLSYETKIAYEVTLTVHPPSAFSPSTK